MMHSRIKLQYKQQTHLEDTLVSTQQTSRGLFFHIQIAYLSEYN